MYMLYHFITCLYVIPNCIILPPHKSLNYKDIFLSTDSFFLLGFLFLVSEKPLNLKVLILPRFPFSWSDSPLVAQCQPAHCLKCRNSPSTRPHLLASQQWHWGEQSTMQLTYGSRKAWPCTQRQLQPLALCLKTGARTPAPAKGG